MALRSDAQGDKIEWTGGLPANVRPFTICGWAKAATDRNNWQMLATFEYDSDNNISLNWYDGAGTALTVYVKFGGVGEWYYEQSVSITHGEWFFWALSLESGASQAPTLYWRSLSETSLNSYNGGGSDTSNFAPAAFQLFYDDNFPTEWFDGAQAGVRWWSAVLTSDEILRESYSLVPRRWADLVLSAPMVGGDTTAAAQDISGQRSGSVTGLAVEDGPPISWGAPIWLPQVKTISVPTLSLPGVQDITATSARPKVTLTW